MLSLATLFGGALYQSISADLQLYLLSPRVFRILQSGSNKNLIMPDETKFAFTDYNKYIIIGETSTHQLQFQYNSSFSLNYYSIVAASADNSFSGSGVGMNPPGGWITTTGFSNSANNGTFQVLQRSCDGSKVYISGSLVNETISVTPPTPPPVTVTRGPFWIGAGAGKVAVVALGYNPNLGKREWYTIERTYGSPVTADNAMALGGTRISKCVVVVLPPPPPPPPPPYEGISPGLSGAASSYGVTVTGATSGCSGWNGAYRVNKFVSGAITYWRHTFSNNAYIDLRAYPPGGGYGYIWQVVFVGNVPGLNYCPKRFGNNTVGTAPPSGSYTCINLPAEGSNCSFSPGMTVVVGP